jgi:hypothetical protein
MSLRSLVHRRPSAALIVSFLALFVALGGAGYAALRIPPNSVGTAQLQNFSVGNAKLKPNSVGPRKIIAGSVGAAQVESSQVQLRVTGPCSMGAIQSIALSGNPTCTPVLPNEYGTAGPATTLGFPQSQAAALPLPGAGAGTSYLLIANVQVAANGTSGTQSFDPSCTLAVGSAAISGQVPLPASGGSGMIPLVLPVNIPSPSGTATVTCNSGPNNPTVTVHATINAIQTASNN